MLVFPDTPPLPVPLKSSSLPVELLSLRSSLSSLQISSYPDSVRYAMATEQYLDGILRYIANACGSTELISISKYASSITLTHEVPWIHLSIGPHKKFEELKELGKKLSLKKSTKSTDEIEWTLFNELETVVISLSFIYIKVGSELTNELIDESMTNINEATEKWKQVINMFKKSISFSLFGLSLNSSNSAIYVFINKVAEVCIQMSILSKSSWINRNQFNETETFQTSNNGALARVAVFIVNEFTSLKNLIIELQSSSGLQLDSSQWLEYLNVVHKYSQAYAGLFLSIEKYQQDKLGHAIGLVHYSLLSLQSKKIESTNKLKNKFINRKNDGLLLKLNSLSTLNINQSIFNSSQITLNDMTYLFDQLIKLNLKFEKENNNLKFDTVVDWSDINHDSKWPVGNKIPVSTIESYKPFNSELSTISTISQAYSGRGAYY